MRTPDFENNTLRVLRGEKPERVPLFELFMNDPIYTRLAGHGLQEDTQLGHMRLIVDAMAAPATTTRPATSSISISRSRRA